MLRFHIPGKPVAQSRPRFSTAGGFPRAYDAEPAKDYKSWVKECALSAQSAAGLSIIDRDIPLRLHVVIDLPRPKSKPKRFAVPTSKPDCDNVLKGIQDAMESIIYQADQQIVAVSVIKRYSETPGVSVALSEYKD